MATKLPTLYSRSSTGALRQWTMNIDGDSYWAEYGQVDGAIIKDNPTIAEAKNVGRSNETTPEEQALSEAKSRWQKQVDSGYVTDADKVDDEKSFYPPMLAVDYFKVKKKRWPALGQPKLDGIRNIATHNRNQSREGKTFVACPHVTAELEEVFNSLPGLKLDGEFYNHDLKDDFNEIVSQVKKTKPTEEDLKQSAELVQYWVYDCISGPGFSESDSYEHRMNILKNNSAFQNALSRGIIKLVPSVIINNEQELESFFEKCIEEGYEGSMIRFADGEYESDRRSKSLLKYKNFIESEFTVLDIEESKKGKRVGTAGKIHFKTHEDKPFKANIKGNMKFFKELLVNKDLYIGQQATVIYFKPTPDGIPRFPRVKAIRNYE